MYNITDVRIRANDVLQRAADSVIAYNNKQRVSVQNDCILHNGSKVYGILNDTICSIGYNNCRHSILPAGEIYAECKNEYHKVNNLNLSTDPFGISWNGKYLNPELLNTDNIVRMSDTLISNILSLCSSAAGLPKVTDKDISTIEPFVKSKEIENKVFKQYPILKVSGWKYNEFKSSSKYAISSNDENVGNNLA